MKSAVRSALFVAGPTVPALNLLGGQVQGFGTFFDRTANLNIVPVNEVDNYGALSRWTTLPGL